MKTSTEFEAVLCDEVGDELTLTSNTSTDAWATIPRPFDPLFQPLR